MSKRDQQTDGAALLSSSHPMPSQSQKYIALVTRFPREIGSGLREYLSLLDHKRKEQSCAVRGNWF